MTKKWEEFRKNMTEEQREKSKRKVNKMLEEIEKEKYFTKEVEGFSEEYLTNTYRNCKCEVKVEPYNNYSDSWSFTFTLPIKKEEDGFSKLEVWVDFDWGYFQVSKIEFDNEMNKICEKVTILKRKTLDKMVEHGSDIVKRLEENR